MSNMAVQTAYPVNRQHLLYQNDIRDNMIINALFLSATKFVWMAEIADIKIFLFIF